MGFLETVYPDLVRPDGISLVRIDHSEDFRFVLLQIGDEFLLESPVSLLILVIVLGQVFPFIILREIGTIAGEQESHHILFHPVPFDLRSREPLYPLVEISG